MSSQPMDIYGCFLIRITANGVTSDPVPEIVGIPMYFAFLPSDGKRKARLRISWILNPSHGSRFVVVRRNHITLTASIGDHHQVRWLCLVQTLSSLQYHVLPVCDIWMQFNIWRLVHYTVATFVQLVDNTLNETEFSIDLSVTIITRSISSHVWRYWYVQVNFEGTLNHYIISTFPYFLDV